MRRGALALLLLLVTSGFQIWGQEEKGNRAYRRGDYPKAAERYREALARGGREDRLSYNLGTALLQLGVAEEARDRLAEGLRVQAPELRARAFYNLGNALVLGSEGGPSEAEILRAALDAYRRALLLEPENDDARWNLELALRRLREAEERDVSLSGQQERPEAPPQGAGAGREQEPRQGGGQMPQPQPGQAPPEGAAELGDAPLSQELAEQILRAVEERERGLQREKLRRQRKRGKGPDW